MKVLIVEDEELASERLRDLIVKYDPATEILASLDTVKDTLHFLRENVGSIDLIFLDVQLADGKSFEIFRRFNVMTPVIFTTAFDSYAMEAFELNSIDYLMKPISEKSLYTALDKFARVRQSRSPGPALAPEVAAQLINQKKHKNRFVVNSGNRILFKDISGIGYFYAQDKTAYLYDRKESRKFLIDYTLDQLEGLLDPEHFFRINRSVVVNLSFIREVRKHPGKRLQIMPADTCREDMVVSRNRVGDFKQWLEGSLTD